MTDTDKYEETDHPELVEFEGETLGDTLTNLLVEVKRLREENDVLAEAVKEDNEILKKHIETLAEVKRLREQYLELRDALVGDSPNWTHDELYGRALELSGGTE